MSAQVSQLTQQDQELLSFHAAVQTGDMKKVQDFIEAHPDSVDNPLKGKNALIKAIEAERPAVIRKLILAGAKVDDAVSKAAEEANLSVAVIDARDEAFNQFLDDCAKGNVARVQRYVDNYPKRIDEMAAKGEYQGHKALYLAVKEGQQEVAEFLVRKGADLDDRRVQEALNKDGQSAALQYAVMGAQADLQQAQSQAQAQAVDADNARAAKRQARAAKRQAEAEAFREQVKQHKAALLQAVVTGGDEGQAQFKELLKSTVVAQNKSDFLNFGYGREKTTLLMLAAERGDKVMMGALLLAGADPAQKDSSGKTYLGYYASQAEKAAPVTPPVPEVSAQSVVTDSKAAVAAADEMAEEAEKQAQKKWLDSIMTKNEGSDYELWDRIYKGKWNLALSLLENSERHIDTNLGYQGKTALMHAAEAGQVEVVKLLLEQRKANINAQDKSGKTALMYAVRAGQKDVVKELMARGADTALQDKAGFTALGQVERALCTSEIQIEMAMILQDRSVQEQKGEKAGEDVVSEVAADGVEDQAVQGVVVSASQANRDTRHRRNTQEQQQLVEMARAVSASGLFHRVQQHVSQHQYAYGTGAVVTGGAIAAGMVAADSIANGGLSASSLKQEVLPGVPVWLILVIAVVAALVTVYALGSRHSAEAGPYEPVTVDDDNSAKKGMVVDGDDTLVAGDVDQCCLP